MSSLIRPHGRTSAPSAILRRRLADEIENVIPHSIYIGRNPAEKMIYVRLRVRPDKKTLLKGYADISHPELEDESRHGDIVERVRASIAADAQAKRKPT